MASYLPYVLFVEAASIVVLPDFVIMHPNTDPQFLANNSLASHIKMDEKQFQEKRLWQLLLTLAPLSVVAMIWAVYNFGSTDPHAGMIIVAIATLFLGSFLRVQLPGTNIFLSLSDAMVFLSMLMYGAGFGILLGLAETVFNALIFVRQGVIIRKKTLFLNSQISVLSIFASAITVTYLYNPPELLLDQLTSSGLVLALFSMAITQFVINTTLVSVLISLKNNEKITEVLRTYTLNALVMYLSSVLLAGLMAKALQQIDIFLFSSVVGLFLLVYLTYTRYVKEIRNTADRAELAERQRAEQAETHVSELEHYIAELEKSSQALSESRERFRHAAYHDALTGLANRIQFIERLHAAMLRSNSETHDRFAVFFLDLNRFKTVNDSLGHSAGDRLILDVAGRLAQTVGGMGMVSRFSGDEFAIILENVVDGDSAIRFAEKINEVLAIPYEIDGRSIFTTASIGIVFSNPRYKDADELLRDADIAMYYAKHNNSGYVIFDQIMHSRAVSLLELETDLRMAVDRNEFELYYQPLVDLDNVELMGFEALVRWHHPRRGLIMPNEFISLAETTGLIVPITKSLLKMACEQIAEWQSEGIARKSLVVSVNLPAAYLEQFGVVDQLRTIIFESGISPECLKLEITESAVMKDAENVIKVLNRIKELGVRMSIDDFGTGYSSLSYLQRFPIDTLKIDRSFVGTMEDGSENGEIVRTIIAMAKALRMSVIAEGVESIHQLHQLRILGCDYGQGYLFSRPVPASEARKLLSDQSPWQNILPMNEYGVIARNLEYTQMRIN